LETVHKLDGVTGQLDWSHKNLEVINSLLQLSLESVPLDELLERTLELLTSIPWIALQSKGSILLVEEQPEVLVTRAQKGLEERILATCSRVPFGRCLCGLAASTRQIQFAADLDDRHTVHFAGMPPHGHYCVPILFADRLLGVINLYVKAGHLRHPKEEEFLTAVANTLAGIIARREAEEARVRSEREFNLLLKNVPALVFKGFADGSVYFFDDRVKEMTGYAKTFFESKKLKWTDLIFEEDIGKARMEFIMALKGGRSCVREYRINCRDGRVLWIQERSHIVLFSNGRIDYIGGVVLDITERRQAEEALREVQSQQRAILDNIPDIAWLKDRESRYIAANEPFALACGFSREELVGKTDLDFWPRDLAIKYRQDDAEVIRTGQRQLLEEPFVGANGKTVWIETIKTPVYNDQGEVIGTTGIAREFTARKQAADELRRAHKEIEQLFESIPFMMIGISPDGRISHWNHEAAKTLWIKETPVAGRKLQDYSLSWEWDKVFQGIKDCQETGKSVRVEGIHYGRPDSKDGLLGISISPITEEDGRISGLILLGRDITERRLLEAQLAQAQKLESIGQLAAGLAHEINTPIQYVGDNTRFLRDAFQDLLHLEEEYGTLLAECRTGAVAPSNLERVEGVKREIDLDYLMGEIPTAISQSLEGVERVTKIVRAMKDFSHPGTVEKQAVDLNKAIESTITVARNEWKYVAEMVTDLDPSLPLVPCRSDEFNQVILNIIINAAHAIAEVVGREPAQKGTITIKTRRRGDGVEVSISDSGRGIPEEIRTKIFDPFFTTKEVGRGTGQGLAISHAVIVEKHGGAIDFETTMGQGTTFFIRLPAAIAK
jgi:PAS domain S-box-containing protein